MTGHPAYNVEAFRDAAARWAQAGWDIATPFEANSIVWRKHYNVDFDPFVDTCDYGDPILKEMFAEDVRVLLSSDAIILLPGWEQSKGATLERRIADQFSIPALRAEYPAGSVEHCIRA
jgi:hypothetical protein